MLDEAVHMIRGFCQQAGWHYLDFSQTYSGVVLHWVDPDADPVDKDKDKTPPLVEETLRGAIATPPDTESLQLLFDRTGRLTSYMELPLFMIVNPVHNATHYAEFLHQSVKTSGATESHASICILLHLLKEKYIHNLDVHDDTGFWGSWDFKRMRREHAQMGALLGLVRDSDPSTVLRTLGVDLPEGARIEVLDPKVESAPPKVAKAESIN